MADEENQVVEDFKELGDLCSSGEQAMKHRRSVFRSGGHKTILLAMRKHETSWRIQAEGCRALANISSDRPATKAAIASLGGVEITLDALKRFPGQYDVQRNGIFLLKNLCKCKEAATRVVEHPEGITTLIKAIKSEPAVPDNTEIQGYACVALANIATHKNLAHNDQIVMAGGLVAIAEAKAKHPANEDVQKVARVSMKLLVR